MLPHTKTRGIPAADLAMGFLAGILAGTQKLAQVGYLRSDVMLPALLAIERIGTLRFQKPAWINATFYYFKRLRSVRVTRSRVSRVFAVWPNFHIKRAVGPVKWWKECWKWRTVPRR